MKHSFAGLEKRQNGVKLLMESKSETQSTKFWKTMYST